ncbi:hypothetical protein J5U18_08445 [Sphingobacteriaceae bacterium WQ 2009]|uniref:Uncharacterized protein n=1 Tax=Rhinopithecimicrobium faecis TaxID=2820698 RepID=A0A8T4HE11_9SPHI|nr:hypothetical protein [Sphingobacteriaceae bacterium WQ 2009]
MNTVINQEISISQMEDDRLATFNGPEDDSDDIFEDDFDIEDIVTIEEFGDFDDEEF